MNIAVKQNLKPYVTSNDDYEQTIKRMSKEEGPTFFKLVAQLPKQGRTDTVMAASPTMTVVLKTYAQGGENALHRHVHEDHTFVVLQGEAEFYGPAGETRRAKKHEGVMLPNTAYYYFKSVGEEPLVMLRVGAATGPDVNMMERVDDQG